MRRVGLVVALIAAAVLGGCGSDDDGGDDLIKPPAGYPARTSPQNVLEAMRMAYVARDSIETKDLYDSTYVGTSTDLSDAPETQLSTFRYADEMVHIAALARLATISGVFLDFGVKSSWTRLPSDDPSHPEWALIQLAYTSGRIYDGGTQYSFQSTSPMTFAFTPTVAAPGDTTWKIVRWTEVGTSS